jgi:hypothetical protein
MQGIEKSRRFCHDVVLPALENTFGAFMAEVAVALIGEGSEVLGYDDAISEDHNFWPRVTVFFTDERFRTLQTRRFDDLVARLPPEFEGHRLTTQGAYASVTFQPLTAYFRQYLSASAFPLQLSDWLVAEEQRLIELASATIFHDPSDRQQSGPFGSIQSLLCRS